MKHRFPRLVGLGAVLACAATGCQAAPTIKFRGQGASVVVQRDTLGIPHIYGESDADVAYGAGYMQAVDRLFQMDLMRRRALGRSSEVFGPSHVDEDTLIRTIDMPRWGRETVALMRRERPRDAQLVDAWVAGVNRRVDEVRSGAVARPYGFGPGEFDYLPEPYTADDALAVGRLVEFGNGQEIEYDALATMVRNFFPDLFANGPLVMTYTDTTILPVEERPVSGAIGPLTPATPGAGQPKQLPPAFDPTNIVRGLRNLRPTASNNWAVDGAHTANGRPVIAGDPHQGLSTPNVLWAHQMNSRESGGAIDVIGFGFVGTPGIQLGHNDRVAWTATVAYPDITDLFEVNPPTDGQIYIDEKLVAVVERTETIAVRGQADVAITVTEVPGYGVLLPDDLFPIALVQPPDRVLLQWSGFRAARDPSAFLGFDRARSVADFERALDAMEQGSFNWIYADANDIGYRVSILVPDRGVVDEAHPPYALLDGTVGHPFWPDRFLSRAQMPHSTGGAQGFLVSANNDPLGFMADGRIANDPYYYGAFFDPGTRAARITAELTRLIAAGPVTADQMKTLQMDTVSVFAERMVPLLLAAHAQVGTNAALAAYVGRTDLDALAAELSGWDHRFDRSASAPVIAESFLAFLAKRVLRDDLGVLFDAINDADIPTIFRITGLVVERKFTGADALMQEGRELLLMQAFDDTAAWLTSQHGTSNPTAYTWGDVHGVRLSALGNLAGYTIPWTPSDGGIGTVNVGNTTFLDTNGNPRARLNAGGGAVYRMVATFDADGTPRAEVVFPPGNSGDPADPHFDDLLADWIDGVYHPLPFARADVDAATTSTIVIDVQP